MPDYITPKLPNRVIVVTKDCDRVITVRRRDPVTGVPVNWDATVSIKIDIQRNSPTSISGSVVGSVATIRIESTVLDEVKTGTTWRVIMSQAGTPRLETAVLVGTFERNDGR
jgi:hypothetical protein